MLICRVYLETLSRDKNKPDFLCDTWWELPWKPLSDDTGRRVPAVSSHEQTASFPLHWKQTVADNNRNQTNQNFNSVQCKKNSNSIIHILVSVVIDIEYCTDVYVLFLQVRFFANTGCILYIYLYVFFSKSMCGGKHDKIADKKRISVSEMFNCSSSKEGFILMWDKREVGIKRKPSGERCLQHFTFK